MCYSRAMRIAVALGLLVVAGCSESNTNPGTPPNDDAGVSPDASTTTDAAPDTDTADSGTLDLVEMLGPAGDRKTSAVDRSTG